MSYLFLSFSFVASFISFLYSVLTDNKSSITDGSIPFFDMSQKDPSGACMIPSPAPLRLVVGHRLYAKIMLGYSDLKSNKEICSNKPYFKANTLAAFRLSLSV